MGRSGKQVSNPLEIKQHAGSGDQEPARGGDRREVEAQGRGGGQGASFQRPGQSLERSLGSQVGKLKLGEKHQRFIN